MTLTQIGYGLGLLLIVPLADLVENRRLALMILGIAVIGLLLSSLAKNASVFLLAASLVGLGSVAVQVLVPYAAHLASDAQRGCAVGNVMGTHARHYVGAPGGKHGDVFGELALGFSAGRARHVDSFYFTALRVVATSCHHKLALPRDVAIDVALMLA